MFRHLFVIIVVRIDITTKGTDTDSFPSLIEDAQLVFNAAMYLSMGKVIVDQKIIVTSSKKEHWLLLELLWLFSVLFSMDVASFFGFLEIKIDKPNKINNLVKLNSII